MSQPVLETIPHRSPLYKPLPRLYAKFEKISVICRAPEEGVKRALPHPLAYVSDIIEVFVYRCPEVHDLSAPEAGPRSYIESGIALQAAFESAQGGHVAYEYVTTDDAMAPGREIWGYPKKMAEVDWKHEGNTISSRTLRRGSSLIDLEFTQGSCTYDKPVLQPRLQIKRIPSADGNGYDVHQVIQNKLSSWSLLETVSGTAQVALGGVPNMDPLFELGPLEVLGAEKIRAEFELSYGEILKDLNRAG
ncbi:acetoacetate decarboxylase family protein [Aquibaculum sediminis]|uniref:acetoacetate decarboxylase family protein n=1 Tax=Aquibaculum sediminis TaxID=3231907 RepID=UPI0034558A49